MKLAALTLAAGFATSQSNTVPGRDMRFTDIESPTWFGRRGPAFPGGEVGIAYSYYACNVGTVDVPWRGPFNGPAPMDTDHPFWAFLVARESGGRMVQISTEATFVKHATSAANSASYCGGSCVNPGNSFALGPGCGDAYSANTNANRFWLGPQDEIDPWLAVWDPIGSYFDRGDPDVGLPANQDGVRSLDATQLTAARFVNDAVRNRVTVRETDLLVPGNRYYQMQMLVPGEAADRRADNIMHRGMTSTWNGAGWSFADSGDAAYGSVLEAWQGATVNAARNGQDDGTFCVAVKVTERVPGTWHYEYAVHNMDNSRGAAAFRIPLCPGQAAANIGFRDADTDPLNQWTVSQVGDELVFQAAAGNPLRWNRIFNFWFDYGKPPASGEVALDQALPGNGAAQVVVSSPVPGSTALVEDLGPGCGAPSPVLGVPGPPRIPSPNFELQFTSTPGAALLLFASFATDNAPVVPGCTRYLGMSTLTTVGSLVTDAAGAAGYPLPIPNDLSLDGVQVVWQAAQIVPGSGIVFGNFSLSNGLRLRIGCR